jgi:TruD family tRNA pseudouridine synthase
MHRFLTADIPGTGGAIKETPEDFQVWEIPVYPPCGEGEHTFTEIEKRGITTLEAVRRFSRALDIPERDMGYAGMKDARGITRQTLSIPRTPPRAAPLPRSAGDKGPLRGPSQKQVEARAPGRKPVFYQGARGL